jgi:L-fuculose-phosphate aldolase
MAIRESEFGRIGARLFAERLVGANFGNMSVRSGPGFFITRSGSYLDAPGTPVFIPMDGEVPAEASSEYRIHREIYRNTRHAAIVHAHPPLAVVCSLMSDRVVPLDAEGMMLSPVIPVVEGMPGSDELASRVATAFGTAPVVIARGHGTFAGGKTLDEAYVLTSLAEHSCCIILLLKRQDRSGIG